MSSIAIIPYNPQMHSSLIPQIVSLHITTILTDNIVMRFHPPFTSQKHQQVLDFWTARLNAKEIESGQRTTLLGISTLPQSKEANGSSSDRPGLAPSTTEPSLVGMVELLTPTNALDTGPFRAELEILMVHPDFRRFGHARRLVEELERTALEKGRTQVTLSTTRETLAETHFYPRMGYVKFGMLPGYALQPDSSEDGRDGGGKKQVDGVYLYKNLVPLEEDGEGEGTDWGSRGVLASV